MWRPNRCCISTLLTCLIFLCVNINAGLRAEETSYLESVLNNAREMGLSKDHYWHILLHYKRGLGGFRSLIDDPKFFLAPDGKYDPAAELDATIRAIFHTETGDTKPAVCTFVARYEWIKEKLHLDESRIPRPECRNFNTPIKSFDNFVDDIKPESVTLVFPDAHINSPASMFGHTLLAVETASKSKLLAYAVNYAAVTKETFGPLYAVKGLFGFYRGYFSTLPYYGKLQEYGDIDRRDIWEYPLDLTKDETKRLLMHLYELDNIYSDYYFFDENCSYDLLFLLDAARPSLNLTDNQGVWVIPLDTVKAIKKKGIFLGAEYRPSRTSKIEYLASLLPKEGQVRVRMLAMGEIEPDGEPGPGVSQAQKIQIYDLAIEYLQYLHTSKQVSNDTYTQRFMKMLRARSALGGPQSEERSIPVPPRPDEGHDSSRIGFAIGSKMNRPFQEVSYRPVYHGLLDNGKGYKEGAQIIFADTALRYYSQDDKLKLESVDAINIVSLAPRDLFFKPISWKVDTGLIQRIMEDGKDHMIAHLNPAGGFTWKNRLLGLYYFMMESDLDVGGAFKEKYALGAGASLGLIRNMTDFWKTHLYVRDIYYGLGNEHNLFEARLIQNLVLSTNSSISLEVARSKTREFYQTEFKCGLNLFF
ncbi:MAG TPA: DUF4105 domain-containing protein [Syntrophorhabdaceae bacterium]|nr:DUF4105 domain-containing protein [Syntrophorhabdaceae bacterium]